MEIRRFELQDKELVDALWKECNLVVPWNDPKKGIQRKLKVNSELFLVGVEDDKIVGTIMDGYERHRGWVNYLAVSSLINEINMGINLWKRVKQRFGQWLVPKLVYRYEKQT